MISLWPKIESDELYNSAYMHVQFNYLSDYAESFEVHHFWGFSSSGYLKNGMSALSEAMDIICLRAAIQECNICPTHLIWHRWTSTSVVHHFLEVQDAIHSMTAVLSVYMWEGTMLKTNALGFLKLIPSVFSHRLINHPS